MNPGFETAGASIVRIDPQGGGYATEELPELYERVVESVEAVPGVESASLSLFGLLASSPWRAGITRDGYAPREYEDLRVQAQLVTASHFETMRIPLMRGRYLESTDRAGSPQVALVKQTFARRFFGEETLGRRFGLGDEESARDIEILGVVGDVKYHNLREEAPPVIYLRGRACRRARGRPGASGVGDEQPGRTHEPVAAPGKSGQPTHGGLRPARAGAGRQGLYGVLAYAVAQRTGEIGIRMALGAERYQFSWLVLRDAAGLVGSGALVGLFGAWVTTRLVSSMLYGRSGGDWVAIAAATAVLAGVAGLAAYLPARRASRMDPLVALRHE